MLNADDHQVTALDTPCPRCQTRPVEISNNCYCKKCWFPVIQQKCECGKDQAIYGHSLPNGDIFCVCGKCGSRWVDTN